jgi:hypothetical protein
MSKPSGRWVVYEKRGLEFIHRSKKFRTKREADKERRRLEQVSDSKPKVLGIGFVRSA